MTLNELAAEIHTQARAKGFWDRERSLPERLALLHSEVSEVFEEWRDRTPPVYVQHGKPGGYAVELIDVIIVALDSLAFEGVDIDEIMRAKMAFNAGRPVRHGRRI